MATISDRKLQITGAEAGQSNGGCEPGTGEEVLDISTRNGENSYIAKEEVNLLPGFDHAAGESFDVYIDASLADCIEYTDPPENAGGWYFAAEVVNANDYYPGGMLMPGRKYSAGGLYRYGFNGQEKSSELDPNGNSYTAEFWQYDARIMRRWNIDPRPDANMGLYATFANNPIYNSDPLGDTIVNGAGGTNTVDIDNKVNSLEFYGESAYTIQGTGSKAPIQAVQLRSFTNVFGSFKANWKSDGNGGTAFAGYLNEKGQTVESTVKEFTEFSSSWKGKVFYWLSQKGAELNKEINKDPLAFNLKFSTNLAVGSAMMVAEPTFYSVGNATANASESSAQTAWLFRRGGNLSAFSVLEVPMQMRTVKNVASQAGVGLNGVRIKIMRDPELLGRGVFGLAHKNSITLYPDAFRNYETLVKTLGHERTHIFQLSLFGKPTNSSMLTSFEQAAYGIENSFWQYYKVNK